MRPGDLLRQVRERRQISLERAAEASRIRPRVLEAIEAGETADIPTVYLRGYVRNYARFLGVDPAEIEQRMDALEGTEPEVRTVFPDQAPRRGSERWLKFSSYVAASALIATLTWQFTHEAVKWSQRDAVPGAPTASAPADSTDAAGARNRHLNASIASVEVLSQRAELSGGTAADEAWAAIDDSRTDAAASDGRLLEITTSADTWVEIFGRDDRQIEMDLVRAGTHREYRDDGPFRIMVGRAAAVLVALDGESIDLAPHTRDGVARLTLPAAAPAGPEEAQDPVAQ